MDRSAWHGRYDSADSWMARRPRTVRQQIGRALDDAPAGPLKVIGLRAGDGRDLLHVPAGHPRRHDVRARLLELDPRNAGAASDPARRAHLEGVEAVKGDASLLVWTGTSAPPDRVPLICRWFERERSELRWLSEPDAGYGVGAHRYPAGPSPHPPRCRSVVIAPILRTLRTAR